MNGHPLDLLDVYLDRELDKAHTDFLEVHLRRCPLCRAALDELDAMQRLLSEAGEVLPTTSTPEFWRSLAPKLPSRQPCLGLGWLWGALMIGGNLLVHALLAALLLVGAADLLGLSATFNAAPAAQINTIAGHLPDQLIAVLSTVMGWTGLLLDDSIHFLIPILLGLGIAAGLAFSFLGWSLATLNQRSA